MGTPRSSDTSNLSRASTPRFRRKRRFNAEKKKRKKKRKKLLFSLFFGWWVGILLPERAETEAEVRLL